MSNAVAEARRARNMKLFNADLSVVMEEIRSMMDHYNIGDWESYIVLRKPNCPQSYVINYEAQSGDGFARGISDLHRKSAKEPNQ